MALLSQTRAPFQVTVTSVTDKKLRKYSGSPHELHSWLEDVELATRNMNSTEAVDFMVRHLTDEPREEVRLYSTEDRGRNSLKKTLAHAAS